MAGTVKGSTPADTIRTGLAVCEGYAALFTAMATAVNVESVVVGGHGKGKHTPVPIIFLSA
jgi:transglutaminase/protease-like cytokinesis protein 3